MVTGGAGYLGSRLSSSLLDDGIEVHVVDKLNYGNSGISPYIGRKGFHFHFGDAASPALTSFFETAKPDVVVALAALVGPVAEGFKTAALRSNVDATKNTVNLANKFNARVIYVSTCSNYGRLDGLADEQTPLKPLSHYAETKIEAENIVRTLAGEYITFRFGTLYGIAPRLRLDIILNEWVKNSMMGRKVQIFEPEAFRPLLDIDQACAAISLAIRFVLPVNETYNVHDGNHTKREIAEAVKEALPETEVSYVEKGDPRSYRVSVEKISKHMKIHERDKVEAAQTIAEAISGLNYSAPVYDNVKGYLRW